MTSLAKISLRQICGRGAIASYLLGERYMHQHACSCCGCACFVLLFLKGIVAPAFTR